MPRQKPISASNPPESRGKRQPKTVSPLVGEKLVKVENKRSDVKPAEQVVHEPTVVEPSPKRTPTRATKQPTEK